MLYMLKYILAAGSCLLLSLTVSCQNQAAIRLYDTVAARENNLLYPALVAKFYERNGHHLVWTGEGEQPAQLRQVLIKSIDSSMYAGLDAAKYHQPEIRHLLAGNTSGDSMQTMVADRLFTDAAIALCKDIYQGAAAGRLINYDEVSARYEAADNDFLLNRLIAVTAAGELAAFIASLEPHATDYLVIKNELALQLGIKKALQVKQLSLLLNLQRWIRHFKFDKVIVVNIPPATLRYYQADTIALQMKVVVGKPSTKTPRFAAYCNQVILYPYWNVPVSIALNELLPKVKRNPAVLDAMNMQVVDGSGRVMAASRLNWHAFSSRYFPYRFRQSTGCDNSLGVLKFNLTDPYSVYMHDTNNKTAFLSGYRFYSHGCIRLEEPLLLGNFLLDNKLDTAFLQSCYKEQNPVAADLLKPVAVFVIYSTADTDAAGRIKFYKDVYGLLK